MEVKFTRTAERRYRVSVEGPGVVSSYMDPAPGYHARLPHDMAHFIVENELGINGGVFGQIAAGGSFIPTDLTKRRKIARRRERLAHENKDDALLSERIIYIAFALWESKISEPPSIEGLRPDDIRRVCHAFDEASAVWSKLGIGESMTLVWHGGKARTIRRSRRKEQRLVHRTI